MEKENMPDIFSSLMPGSEAILDEEALLRLFTIRVEELMRDDLGLLLSSLYRLDVLEHKIQKALRSPDVPAAEGIAALIIDRQKERLKTRRSYAKGEQKDWEGL
jgi:hypothetical protein